MGASSKVANKPDDKYALALAVILNNACFPATTGGTIDPWIRLRALKRFGCRMILVTWESNGRLSQDAEAELSAVFDEIHVFSTGGPRAIIRRGLNLFKHSPHVSSRFLSKQDMTDLRWTMDRFGVEAVWVDGLYGGQLGLELSNYLRVPLIYRSHNVEYRYMRSQARQASSFKTRLVLWLASNHLASFESALQNRADMVLEISQSDLDFWRGRGVTHNKWLPTILEANTYEVARASQLTPKFDFGFVGNLSSPNNQQSLQWFVDEILPLVRDRLKEVTVLIAGMNPSSSMLKMLDRAGVEVLPNPPDAAQTWALSHTLFNPIMSGSGINVKTLEMLMFDAPLVSTSVGLRGLPEAVLAEFYVADSTQAFAMQMLNARRSGANQSSSRVGARALFDTSRLAEILNDVRKLIALRKLRLTGNK